MSGQRPRVIREEGRYKKKKGRNMSAYRDVSVICPTSERVGRVRVSGSYKNLKMKLNGVFRNSPLRCVGLRQDQK